MEKSNHGGPKQVNPSGLVLDFREMSESKRTMVYVLVGKYRHPRLTAITHLINPKASTILDLGCGIGALVPYLKKHAPYAEIVGLDRSAYLLTQFIKRQPKQQVSVILAEVPTLPLRPGFFDVALAVQFLHEVFHFIGSEAFWTTIKHVYNILADEGQFIIFDHRHPGSGSIDVSLSSELLRKLDYFIKRFKPRRITYDRVDSQWIRMSLRDFVDFVTKLFAFGSDLEDEEMEETHTPYTNEELIQVLEDTGFTVTHNGTFTPITQLLKRFKIKTIPNKALPERHLLIMGEKTQ